MYKTSEFRESSPATYYLVLRLCLFARAALVRSVNYAFGPPRARRLDLTTTVCARGGLKPVRRTRLSASRFSALCVECTQASVRGFTPHATPLHWHAWVAYYVAYTHDRPSTQLYKFTWGGLSRPASSSLPNLGAIPHAACCRDARIGCLQAPPYRTRSNSVLRPSPPPPSSSQLLGPPPPPRPPTPPTPPRSAAAGPSG